MSELELTAAGDGLPDDSVVNFDNIPHCPVSGFDVASPATEW